MEGCASNLTPAYPLFFVIFNAFYNKFVIFIALFNIL